jgi:16S rRNA C1402 (ribose-2'-O) methylase RsmI
MEEEGLVKKCLESGHEPNWVAGPVAVAVTVVAAPIHTVQFV